QISGGKFANGAILGASSYAFNDAAHETVERERQRQAALQLAKQDAIYPTVSPLDVIVGAAALGAAAMYEAGVAFFESMGVEEAEYTLTKTVENNIASRPYINSPLTIQEIESTRLAVPDPGGLPGALRHAVPGTCN